MTKRTGVPSRDLRRMKNNFLDILEAADPGSPWHFSMKTVTDMDRNDEFDLGVELRAEIDNRAVAELADAGVGTKTGKSVDTNRQGTTEIEFSVSGVKE